MSGDAGVVRYRYCVFSGGKFSHWEGGDNFERKLVNKNLTEFKVETKDKFSISGSKYKNSPDRRDAVSSLTTSEAQSFRSQQFAQWTKRSTANQHLKPSDGVIVVAYFLPVILNRDKNGNWSAQWDKENLLSLQVEARMNWVGSVRYNNAAIPPDEESAVASVLLEMNCFPVFINQMQHKSFYDVYCKQHIWPILHHIADVYGPLNQNDIGAKAQQNLWFVYSTVHKLFREKILEIFQTDYLIWIHGFHLMLLPSVLRRNLPLAKIGYFFHTPFPSSEIWRTMPQREELMRGLLGADQIGFHLYEYARHFLTTCHRLLGFTTDMNASGNMSVDMDGREVRITCVHVGVDKPRADEILLSSSFENQTKMWKDRFPNKVVIAGSLLVIVNILSGIICLADKMMIRYRSIGTAERYTLETASHWSIYG